MKNNVKKIIIVLILVIAVGVGIKSLIVKKGSTNNTDNTENITKNENINNEVKIIKKLSPSGWAGSSMQEIRLYSNGDVYHIYYNGEGTTDEYIIEKDLIAKNAEDIQEKITEEQGFEGIIVKGKNTKIIKDEETWIIFENTDNNSSKK